MYYTIYQITNLVNGKFYIGAHKTKELEDGYMGSGKILISAIKKYGTENFKKEILEVFDSSKEMFSLEKELVNEEFIKRKDTYNIKLGGFGGFDYINSTLSIEGRIKNGSVGGVVFKERLKNDPKLYKQYQEHGRKAMTALQNKIKLGLASPTSKFKGHNHTTATKSQMSETRKGTGKGEANSQFGTCWITNVVLRENKKIKKTDLVIWLEQGWIKGRKVK